MLSAIESFLGNLVKVGMGFAELRQKAQAYLKAAAGTAAETAQAAENQRLRDEIEALKAMVQEVAPRRGRPRKEDEAITSE